MRCHYSYYLQVEITHKGLPLIPILLNSLDPSERIERMTFYRRRLHSREASLFRLKMSKTLRILIGQCKHAEIKYKERKFVSYCQLMFAPDAMPFFREIAFSIVAAIIIPQYTGA